MRWLDTTEGPAWRNVAAWQASRHEAADDAVASVAERARGATAATGPIVALSTRALAAAWGHVHDSAVERGGLLIGEPFVKASGETTPALVHVRAAVAGLDDEATSMSLRLHTGVWDAARAALQPGEVVVGWFHSHPGIGAFFSGTDRQTQAGFFHHPFSLGWVIDPQRREQAWFVGPLSDGLALHRVVKLG
ncbi:MAG TPA: Mov34/MPN/PAD-1 family protein [Rubrivivax sp.]